MEDPSQRDDERHNFLSLALHGVFMRIGWIFKTETIVMPAFMDFIGGGPVLRGCLPVLNRFGFAVPPVLFARRLNIMKRKKWALVLGTTAIAVPFAALSLLWGTGLWQASPGVAHAWMPWLFLVLYGVFFSINGLNQLAAHTLHGKLIRASHRGRLFTVSICIGAPLAILAASMLMPGWLALPDGGYGWIFAAAAIPFLAAGFISLALREAPDQFAQPATHPLTYFAESAAVVRDDANFRRLALAAGLFSATFMLFPHYQALGRERLELMQDNLMLWVCAQNSATALASLLAGPLADRYGNRLALQVMVCGCLSAPLLAVGLVLPTAPVGQPWFWLVFLPLGMTPVTIKLLINYTLEVAPRENHPRYVSTLGLVLALPVICGAPLVGLLVRTVGFEAVFLAGAGTIGLAAAQTFRLAEPRHAVAN